VTTTFLKTNIMETATQTLNYTELAEGISEWLKEYAQNAGQKGFVMGVSGGIDSAVVSALCARTGLPLLILEMPIHQGEDQVTRAKKHIAWLKDNYPNVTSREIDLTSTYDALYGIIDGTMPEGSFDKEWSRDVFDFSAANSRSRLRMTTLYHVAGVHKMLVAGTGNKVEDFGIGFYTKYGDGGVDISPIADLMKSEVYALGAELELGVGEDILTAAPTDGLHDDGRTDEDQIGATYDELEWAMYWIADHIVVETGVGPWYDESDDSSLTERQIEVLDIYRKFHNTSSYRE
jgi:NAD+ synthase